jgi:hypothetical protein
MQVKTPFITAWLPDTEHKFQSQYGMVTNRQWLELERKRIPGSRIIEDKGQIALRY